MECIGAGDPVYHAQCRGIDHLHVAIAGVFEVGVEEGLVAQDRPADAGPGLGALEAFAHRVARQVAARKRRFRIERAAGTHQGIDFAGQVVAARRRGVVDHAIGGAPVGHRIGVGEHRHLAGEAKWHRKLQAAEKVLVVVEPVEQITGVEAIGPVDRYRRCFGEEAGRGHDIGQADKCAQDIAAFDGERGQFFPPERGGHFGIHGVQLRDPSCAGDDDGSGTHGDKAQRHAAGKVGAQADAGLLIAFVSTPRNGRDTVGSCSRQPFDPDKSPVVRASCPREADVRIFDLHVDIRHGLVGGSIYQRDLDPGLLGACGSGKGNNGQHKRRQEKAGRKQSGSPMPGDQPRRHA